MSRLSTMVLMGIKLPLEAVMRQIASGIDILVHLGRLRDKSRKVLEIMEVLGYEKGEIRLQPLFSFQETGSKDGKIQGEWVKRSTLTRTEKLMAAMVKTKKETDRTTGIVLFLFVSDGCFSKETQAHPL